MARSSAWKSLALAADDPANQIVATSASWAKPPREPVASRGTAAFSFWRAGVTGCAMAIPPTKPAADPALWPLDPEIDFLNHGSFGSCPLSVLEVQGQFRRRLERQPVQFLVRELEGLLDDARASLARFVGTDPDDLVFITNATTGVNAVLRSLAFEPGDELLVTDHEYNACRNALNFVAQRSGARVVVVPIPFPLERASTVIDAVMEKVSSRTRLVLIDHVTSPTGMVLPLAEMVARLEDQGIDTLVDGAHAPGMLPLDLDALGATYYTGNCHKWIGAPKGAAFLRVRQDRQADIRPLVVSHGANSTRTDRSRFQIEFGWMGTGDPTACLTVPSALEFMAKVLPGGWPAVMQRNRELALAGRQEIAQRLGVELPCPDDMIGSLAALQLPDSTTNTPSKSPLYMEPLQDELVRQYGIEVPIIPWPEHPRRLVRISAQLYNDLSQYDRLGRALEKMLA